MKNHSERVSTLEADLVAQRAIGDHLAFECGRLRRAAQWLGTRCKNRGNQVTMMVCVLEDTQIRISSLNPQDMACPAGEILSDLLKQMDKILNGTSEVPPTVEKV